MWKLFRWQLAAFSAGAAALHFAEIEPHLEEWWVFAAFFFAVAWFQAGWAILVVLREGRALLVTSLAVNAAIIFIWIWSRTAGLPIGPEAGEPEAVGAADLLATAFEWFIALGIGLLLSKLRPARDPSQRTVIVSATFAWVLVVATTALVFFFTTEEAVGPH